MSYYAQTEGVFDLSSAADIDTVCGIIEKARIFDNVEPVYDEKEILVSGNVYYRDEYLGELYSEIGKYLESASVKFSGEDGCLWKHEYQKGGDWMELYGKVTYENPSFFAENESEKEPDR